MEKKEWDGAKELYEMLEVEEELKPFVTNHKLNFYDYHTDKCYSRFHTENRFVFELLSNSDDEDKLGEIIKTYLNDYLLDEETTKAIFGMLGIKEDINKYKKRTEKGVRFHMCKAWDDHKESGRREGRQDALKESLVILINSLKKFSTDINAIYDAVVENELYKDVTMEQVKNCYFAK